MRPRAVSPWQVTDLVLLILVAAIALSMVGNVAHGSERSGGCNHIPLTADAHPACACLDQSH